MNDAVNWAGITMYVPTVFEQLFVWVDGYASPVGQLTQYDDSSLGFEYFSGYASAPDSFPLSLSLSLREQKFGDYKTRAFFGNLIPEGRQAWTVSGYYGINANDIFAFLYRLGADCAGAVKCLPSSVKPSNKPSNIFRDYVPVADTELTKVVQKLHEGISTAEEQLSNTLLSGTQVKLGLVYDGPERGFLAPKPGSKACTTHILKIPRKTNIPSALEEVYMMQLARKLGLQVAAVESMKIGGIDVVLVQRFDRKVSPSGNVTCIHQEDFAQACGLHSLLKYQRHGLNELMFNATNMADVLSQTSSAENNRIQMLLLSVFNLAVGNTDNHAKNHALQYRTGNQIGLAPAYDLVPTDYSSNETPELAFNIGEARYFECITRSDWYMFAASLGFTNTARVEELFAIQVYRLLATLKDLVSKNVDQKLDRLNKNIHDRCVNICRQLYGSN